MRRSFFKRLDDPLVLSRVTRPGADVREAKLLQQLSDITLMELDAEPLGDDALEVDAPPPHHAVLLTIRAGLDDGRELDQMLRRQARLGPLCPVVDEPLRPLGVEAMHPVAQRPAVHAADLRRRPPIHSVANRRKRQQSAALVDVLRATGRARSSSAEKSFCNLTADGMVQPSMPPCNRPSRDSEIPSKSQRGLWHKPLAR